MRPFYFVVEKTQDFFSQREKMLQCLPCTKPLFENNGTPPVLQTRRQKIFNRGCRFMQGGFTFRKFDENFTDL